MQSRHTRFSGTSREELHHKDQFRDVSHTTAHDFHHTRARQSRLGEGRGHVVAVADHVQKSRKASDGKHDVLLGSDCKRFVTFYFTNFPEQIPHFYLRKGFVVCGMLDDVFVARRHNVHGEIYGFMRFSKVKYVNKLSKR